MHKLELLIFRTADLSKYFGADIFLRATSRDWFLKIPSYIKRTV